MGVAVSTNDIDNRTIKVVQALGVLLGFDANHKMERIKLIKLLWAADRYHLRKYGRTVSNVDNTDYFAMVHGPVSSLALDIAQIHGDFALSDKAIDYISTFFTADSKETGMTISPGESHLSNTDRQALSWAWDTFSTNDTFELADSISHSYPEWNKYEQFFAVNQGGRKQINIADFFENPDQDSYFTEDDEVLAAAKEAYLDKNVADRTLRQGLKL